MKILGIDPGYERMGVAIIERDTSKKDVVVFYVIEHERQERVPVHVFRVSLDGFFVFVVEHVSPCKRKHF